MKKLIACFLLLTLILTGCAPMVSQTTEPATQTVEIVAPEKAPAQMQETIPEAADEEMLPEELEENLPDEMEETLPEVVEEAVETPKDTNGEAPALPEAAEPEQNQTDSQPTTSQPATSQSTTSQPATSQPTTSQPTTSQPSGAYPTSSSTCKDTGADTVWDFLRYNQNPVMNGALAKDYEERDPEREGYIWLIGGEMPYLYYMHEETMLMYVGKTYGIPLVTSPEVFLASTWVSSDPSVAMVNHRGFVTPLKGGKVTISATIVDPETQDVCTRKCEVTVKDTPCYTYAQLEEMAKAEAQKIANTVMRSSKCTTDLERIAYAAHLVSRYVARGRGSNFVEFVNGMVESQPVPGYNQPYGTLITNHSSCAGDARALGMVLEYMGFEWYHVNANQWEHQWCIVYNVDGQTAFADCSYNCAGYGPREAGSQNWVTFRYNELTPY